MRKLEKKNENAGSGCFSISIPNFRVHGRVIKYAMPHDTRAPTYNMCSTHVQCAIIASELAEPLIPKYDKDILNLMRMRTVTKSGLPQETKEQDLFSPA